MEKKRNIVEYAMHYRQIVIMVVCCLIAFGIYSLPNMRKNEFPDFTIRQGIVVAVAPGNTAEEMEQQVTKPLENYIFTYKEVKKEKTFSMSRDGIVYIQVQLNDNLNNKDEFWSKFKHGVQDFKSSLPSNVMAVVVQDDFGDTSSLLITMESKEKTYRELSDYMDRLQDRLRGINSVGRLTVSGMQQEQIAVTLDNERLAKYGLSDQVVAATLFQKGFTTTGGRIKSPVYTMPIHVAKSLNSIYDIKQQIVYSSPTGTNVRLKDIATVKREYPDKESQITNNGKKCLLLSVEMKKGQNIVKMGEAIDKEMAEFQKTLPKDVGIYRITDQSRVVDIAALLVPFMQFFFIRKPLKSDAETSASDNQSKKKPFSFLDILQKYYDKLLNICFAYPKTTLTVGIGTIVLGVILFQKVPQQTMPFAERNQFAVEIYLPTGTSLDKTSEIADSLEHILHRDKRIVSITSFKGCASPRFHTAYAPQIAGTNYAQFVVNTTDDKATVDILNDDANKYGDYFPEAVIKFKQLSYNEATNPIEIRLSNEDESVLPRDAEKIMRILQEQPELSLIRTDFKEPQATTTVRLKEDEATRIGITNAQLEATLAMRYGSGMGIANVWEGDKQVPVVLKSTHADIANTNDLKDEQLPVMGGLKTVPLRQVADIVPTTQYGQIVRRNGIPTITIMADVKRGYNAMSATAIVQERLKDVKLSDGTKATYGGDYENSVEQMGPMGVGLTIAAIMIFFILVIHFKKLNLATLIFLSMLMSIFGTAVGLLIQGCPFSVTSILGIVSLMGIIVRNGIIMYDYAEELREKERMNARDAIWHSASRRMRPIFLTSAAASMGVIPMILGGSGLWMPMGTVICYGTLISMVLILTVVPIAYLLTFEGTEKKRMLADNIEEE